MHRSSIQGWSLLALILTSTILQTIAYPNSVKRQILVQQAAPQPKYLPISEHNNGGNQEDTRKFAEKPNYIKKVALDDIDDDIQTNQIQDGGFSWSNMLGM